MQKTFAQALSNVCDIPQSQLPIPSVKGHRLSIIIPEDECLLDLETCKYNLHARIIWPKGFNPLTIVALQEKPKPLRRWGHHLHR